MNRKILRHDADMCITLDLDDGVKVNYGNFGGLLAEVKAVTGGRGMFEFVKASISKSREQFQR